VHPDADFPAHVGFERLTDLFYQSSVGTFMSLDISTLYLVATLVAAMLGALLLFFWRRENIAALGWWGAAYLTGGGALGVWALAEGYLDVAALQALKLVGFLACGMVWNAARVFHGRPPNWAGMAAGAVVWGIATLFPVEFGSLHMLMGAAIVAGYAAFTANELASERRKTYRSRWPTVFVPLLHGVVLMLPILFGNFIRPETGELDGHSGWVAAFAIEMVLYAIGTVFVIFILVSERTVNAHKTAATVDPLTNLFNRRGFSELTGRMIVRETAAGRPVAVMIFDIDHFKSVNDRFGHPAGDEVLKLFANVLVHGLRLTDIVGRIGGEEFAAMLPCSLDEALIAAERVRGLFERADVHIDLEPLPTTVSIGIACGREGAELTALLAAADIALYRAKRGGRNRIEVAVEEEPISLDHERKRAAAMPALRIPSVVHRLDGIMP
jgi:diguanylate cyclase (GGDEF)-like protein